LFRELLADGFGCRRTFADFIRQRKRLHESVNDAFGTVEAGAEGTCGFLVIKHVAMHELAAILDGDFAVVLVVGDNQFHHVRIIPKFVRMSSHWRCERENGTSEAPVSQRSSDNLLRVVVTPVVLVDGVERSVEVAPMDLSIRFDAEDIAG